MDFTNETPSKSKNNHLMSKVLTSSLSCDSPFKLLPHISTPPSRFTRILNPFESHLIERLHLPTFSPSVFAQVSTPKTEDKFKWSIDDISSLKPADIDEETISQHVNDQDPTMESIVQEKIDKFFNEKAIAPSPCNDQVKQILLVESNSSPDPKPQYSDGCTQTLLSLPPVLPKHVEKALEPYFTCSPKATTQRENSSLYRELFDFEEHSVHESVESSPALSTGLSPIQFSPEFNPESAKRNLDSPFDMPELRDCTFEMPEFRDCTLSPIGRSPRATPSRSACRLSFSGHMSLDASLVVPDVEKSLNFTNLDTNETFPPNDEPLSNSSVNWDLEHKQVSILSQSPVSNPEMIDSSNSNTPHSKIFTSQRKRLSDSFKDELDKDVEMEEPEVPRRVKRLVMNDVTEDRGYDTGSTTMYDSSVHMFASTPTKH